MKRWFPEDRGLVAGGGRSIAAGAAVLPIILLGLAAASVAIFPASRYVVIGLAINGILVVGYQLFVGSTGVISFGHVAFMAIGAYVGGILTTPTLIKSVSLMDAPAFLRNADVALVPAVIIAGVVTGLVALISGIGLMRLAGAAASIATLALLVVTTEVLSNATSLTRGTETFYGVPNSLNLPILFGTLTIVAVVSVAFKYSSLGLRARAVRDASLAAETAGVSIVRARMAPWVLSAVITGIAGAYYAQYLSAFSPANFTTSLAIPIIVMAVLGGLNSVLGCIVGAVLLTLWLELMRNVEAGSIFGVHVPAVSGLTQLTVGLGLLALLRLRPRGLLDGKELSVRPRQAPSDVAPSAVPPVPDRVRSPS